MTDRYFEKRTNCPACTSERRREVYSAPFTEPPVSTHLREYYAAYGGVEFEYLAGASFVLDECLECGLIYQRFIPNDFLMNKLYEEWIDPGKVFDVKVKRRGIDHYERQAQEITAIARHLGRRPAELELLDFGMGWGDWCRMAQAYGCSAWGAELSQARIDYAGGFGVPVITWDEIAERRFDFIKTEQVFEHLPNPLETLRYLGAALKPDGILKVSVPNAWNMKARLAVMDWSAARGSANSLLSVIPLEHINCYAGDSLERMGRKAGLKAVEVRTRRKQDGGLLELTLRDVLGPLYRATVAKTGYARRMGATVRFFGKEAA